MKHKSSKQSKLERTHDKERREFRLLFPNCCICGSGDPATHTIDEIVRGGSRSLGYAARAAWIPACFSCNCGPLNSMPVEHKLAIKLCIDPEYFDIEQVNAMRGRAPGAITLVDVSKYLQPNLDGIR